MDTSEPTINYRVAERDLRYYIFDWDDNILHMPTRIHLERLTDDGIWVPHLVSTSVYSVIRSDTEHYRAPGGDWESAFVEFRDFADQEESAFLRDTRRAIERVKRGETSVGPSFETFRRTLIEGRLFAIVTARGHRSDTIRAGVEIFVREMLTPDEIRTMLSNLRGYRACFDSDLEPQPDAVILSDYLNLGRYHAVTSPQFKALIAGAQPGVESSEACKQFAIRDFVRHVIRIVNRTGIRRPISVGFSDDDPANVKAVEQYIHQELARSFPGVKFVVYDTSDPTLENGRKVVVAGQMDLGLARPPPTTRG